MDKKDIYIDAFKVKDPEWELQKVLEEIENSSLEQRDFPISKEKSMRIDEIKREGDVWLLNFGLLKSRGPGLASPHQVIGPANVNKQDRKYAYETAMLYREGDPRAISRPSIALVEFVQQGVQIGRIEKYFAKWVNYPFVSFEQILLDPNPKQFALKTQILKELTFTGTLGSLQHSPFKGLAENLESQIENPQLVKNVKIVITPTNRGRISEAISNFFGKVVDSAEKKENNKVIIVGRNDDGDDWERINPFDVTDILEQTVKLPTDNDDRETASVEERWKALKRALEKYDKFAD